MNSMTAHSQQGVTAVAGFRAAGYTAGIKPSGKPDMALVVNDGPRFDAAAVFTRNRIVAAPVKITRSALVTKPQFKAALYNAGNANACNGEQGMLDAQNMVNAVAEQLGIESTDVAVNSTGLIGEPMPMDKVLGGIAPLVSQLGADGAAAAEAIMTTDTVPKQTLVCGDNCAVGGMAKGVGMMAPSLATMLACLTTDAQACPEMLDDALRKACDQTFNTLDVDGSTSTNDTVLIMASGASGYEPSQEELDDLVLKACRHLADQLQADAEGVSKRVKVVVEGAVTHEQALSAARTIGRDNLFKCAMFGSDPNWGRVLAAVGMADAEMDPEGINVYFNDHPVCINSTGAPGAREVDLSAVDISVRVDLGMSGPGTAFIRTTDLSHDYVEINSAYSS